MNKMRMSVLVAVAVAVIGGQSEGMSQATARPTTASSRAIQRGRYLVTVSGCNDCHSPKLHPGSMQPDANRLLSGRPITTEAPSKPAHMGEIAASGDLTAWYGPWGISYGSNLTGDPTSGIGRRYNEASFIRTLRTGKKPEGSDLLPPMPWPNYASMSDVDLKAVWMYLQTLKPIANNVNAATPPHPVMH